MNIRVWNCRGLEILRTGKELGDTIQAKDPSVVFVAKTLADEARLDRVVQEIEVQDKSLWMGIWSLYVLSKIKSFIWLACRKSLSTKQNLVRWTIINDPHCIRCCETKEHSIYAIWSCLLLDTVWLNTHLWACRISKQFLDFRELLSWIMQNHQQPVLFAFMAWAIWTNSSQTCLHFPCCNLQQLIQECEQPRALWILHRRLW